MYLKQLIVTGFEAGTFLGTDKTVHKDHKVSDCWSYAGSRQEPECLARRWARPYPLVDYSLSLLHQLDPQPPVTPSGGQVFTHLSLGKTFHTNTYSGLSWWNRKTVWTGEACWPSV